jgi:hypothetical protein
MPLVAALICNSRDNAGGDEKSERRAGLPCSTSQGVDVTLGRSGVDMKLKEVKALATK